MSGGIAVKTAPGGGGSPVLHDRREEGRGTRRTRPKRKVQGLALTAQWVASPNKEKSKVSPSGLSEDAQGIEAGWPRPP